MICDLRSDLLAPLAPDVLAAFEAAARRPPGFAWREDPDEDALCREAAALLGFEDALFVPTGTLANQIAVRLWVQPGEGIIADRRSHLATNEAASVAGLNGAILRLADGDEGHLTPEQVEAIAAERPGSAPERRVRLVWLENTHNRAGGTVMPAGRLEAIAAAASRHGLALHVDGARIWNALIASGEAPDRGLRGALSAMVALNKIVGAPAGALLLGAREAIEEAARVQKMFGGLWRPVGPFAAAARAALRRWPVRARQARDAAAAFAEQLTGRCGASFGPLAPPTNIVMLRLPGEAEVARLLEPLADTPVRLSSYGGGTIRCVFHSAITPAMALAAADAVADALEASTVRSVQLERDNRRG